ncbi:hypothetical protein HYU11_04735 [Candidatus Woesearchaeota archaeon]|nr:hypothetical protein [Candidatus Woesearchaeota archaeon]
MRAGKIALMAACLVALIIITPITLTVPPGAHNVKGTVYTRNDAQAPTGIPVLINNTINNQSVLTYTNGPPPKPGAYSSTINGTDGDLIEVTSWNITHYGLNRSQLTSTTTELLAILNTSKKETNLTINMTNNATVNAGNTFNFTVNITMIGVEDGTGCSVTIGINTSLIIFTGPDTSTRSLGNIPAGSFASTAWNLTAFASGSTNITANSSCNSDYRNFDNANSKTAYNITVIGSVLPQITLEAPENMTRKKNNHTIFSYNVTYQNSIENCSLIIDDAINQTNDSISRNASQNFTADLPIGLYNWSVSCTDSINKVNGSSVKYIINITGNFAPAVSQVYAATPIDLTAGSTKEIECNATVLDSNLDDLVHANATFYDSSSTYGSPDSNTSHYSNASCLNISTNGEMHNFTCKANFLYYASNDTWKCNITATDNENMTSTAYANMSINQLIAIETTSSTVDFGNITVTQVSQMQTINVTNLGNIPVNLSLFGYGGDNQTIYENYSQWCPHGFIDLDFERFSKEESTPYIQMHNLTTLPKDSNLTIQKVIDPSNITNTTGTTYWRIKIPAGIGGRCNGTIVFIASAA